MLESGPGGTDRRTVAPEMADRPRSSRPWVRISNWIESRIPIPDVAGSSPAAPVGDVARMVERVPLKSGAVCVNMEAWKTETRTTGTTWRSAAGVGWTSRSRCWAGNVLSAGAQLGWRWTTSTRRRSRSDSLDVICPRHVSWRNWRSASSSAMRATTRRRSWSAGRSQLRGRTGRCRPIDTAIARSVDEQSVSGRGCIDRRKRRRRRSATGARSAVNRRVGSSNLSVAANVPVSQLWKRNLSQKEEKAWVRPPPGTPCAGSRTVHASGSGPLPVERSLGVRVSPRVPWTGNSTVEWTLLKSEIQCEDENLPEMRKTDSTSDGCRWKEAEPTDQKILFGMLPVREWKQKKVGGFPCKKVFTKEWKIYRVAEKGSSRSKTQIDPVAWWKMFRLWVSTVYGGFGFSSPRPSGQGIWSCVAGSSSQVGGCGEGGHEMCSLVQELSC